MAESKMTRYYQCLKCGSTIVVSVNPEKIFATPKCNQCRNNMVPVGFGENDVTED